MDENTTLRALAALSQKTRLDVFRLLVKAGFEGMLAGEIGDRLNVRQNTMSTNLSILMNAGLIKNERQGRTVRYFADYEAMRGLLSFLMDDCCNGRPEICEGIFDEINCS